MGERLPTGTVTFLFSDVEGSTQLWEQHHEEMKEGLAAHDKVMRSSIEDAGGHVFTTAGDSYSAAFADPLSALHAAANAQERLSPIQVGESPLKVRMGVHTGTADERDGDYFGPAVNRVARLMSIGNGRQVLVSNVTAELVMDRLPSPATLTDLGEHLLKDLSRPERVYRLLHEAIPDDDRPLRSLDAYPHNLPIQLTSFVGREEELLEVTKLLSSARMVTLAGVGGAGKTRLAVQSAAEVLAEYADGVWLIELAAITAPERIPSTVMSVLGIDEKADEDPVDTVARALAKKKTLIILDNCEHLVDPAARFAAAILGTSTDVCILATSREMLGVPGEYPFQVRSLASPDSVDEEVRAALIRYPAVRLFSERGELARPGWRLSSDNADSVVQICKRLDGMPLAIELAAARLRMMKTEQIAERLDDRFRLLTGGSRTALPRQQTLEAAIDWSFDLLSDEEKVLFGRLAVFMGGFTLESAEAVCGSHPLDPFLVLDLLGNLLDKSLIQADEGEDGIRYRMLETLRQYARQRLADSQEVGDMRRSHALHFKELVEEAEPNLRGADEQHWFRRLDAELDNIRQAMSWALEAEEPRIAQAMAGALYRYFMYTYRYTESREWAERALEASDEATPERAKALLAAGTIAQFAYDQDVAMKHLDQALDLARMLELDDVLSSALNNRAVVSSGLGMFEEAERLLREHLALARREGELDGAIIGLHNLGAAAVGRGGFEAALEQFEEAESLAIELDSGRLLAHSRGFMFEPLRALGELDRLEEKIHQVIAYDEENQGSIGIGWPQAWLGVVALDRGQTEEAVDHLLDAMKRFRAIPDPYENVWVIQWSLWQGARCLDRVGHSEVAARLLGACDALVQERAYVRQEQQQDQVDEIAAALAESLGQDPFEQLYAEGLNVDARDAHDLLLETLEEVAASSPGSLREFG